MSAPRAGILAALSLAAAAVGPFVPTAPAGASTAGDALVISEIYGAGGNSGAAYNADFVELYNPTGAALPLTGLALHYRSASGGSGGAPVALSGSVPAHGHWLVQMSVAGSTGAALPTPDAVASPAVAMAAAGGQVALQRGTALIATSGDVVGTAGLVDFVGAKGATSFETAPTSAAATATQSLNRAAAGTDTDSNAADLTLAPPTPTPSGVAPGGGGEEPTSAAISEIQGPGDTSPLVGRTVTTTGVVTADYDHGGFNGVYVQDPAGDPHDTASDAVFVYGSAVPAGLEIGDSVSVTGTVSEFQGTTEVTPSSGGVTTLTAPLGTVTPLSLPWSELDTDAEKEAHEGELVAPAGDFTVSDNYDANVYGSFLLAAGDRPLVTPTDVADAQDTAAVAAVKADNAARSITLDDGASTSFRSAANRSTPLPYLTPANPVRIGSAATFHEPVVLEYRYGAWTLQPTRPVTGDGTDVVTFSDTRADNLAPRDVGGDVRLATFNVLNYFPTTGESYVAAGLGTCTYYDDRDGQHVTDNTCVGTDGSSPGPRGAATAESLARQQVKIVKAINGLGASIVSLEELENSVWFGQDRDAAIGRLVDALNAQAGAGTWAYAPSPASSELPPLAEQDVIRTGFIYKPADIALVGTSHVLHDQSGAGQPFDNAREPLAQAFKAAGAPDADAFLVIVNHFKSKGSGVDDGTGQGNANPDRVAQATALKTFAAGLESSLGLDKVFLTGDFNAYSQEDPVQLLESDTVDGQRSERFHELNGELNGGEATYSFDGAAGSLDHVFANDAARAWVTGVDVWQINAQEQVGFEYSRYNDNATLLYDDSVFRASDHNPEVVGLDLPALPAPLPPSTLRAAPVASSYGHATRARVRVVSEDGRPGPTGTVTLREDGVVVGSGTIGAGGWADVPLSGTALTPGTHTLLATYGGDTAHAGASATVTVRVAR